MGGDQPRRRCMVWLDRKRKAPHLRGFAWSEARLVDQLGSGKRQGGKAGREPNESPGLITKGFMHFGGDFALENPKVVLG
ncbi:hypothetical protein AAHB60_06150 [Pseudomonas aeruginosa]